MPKVERIIYLPDAGEQQIGAGADHQPDRLLASTCSRRRSRRSSRQNPKIITHTGQKPPYGYVDWWPTSLYVNNEREPFNDPDVRWALSYFIDREQIDRGRLSAAPAHVSPLPMPTYPALQPFFDAVKDLLAKYDTLEFNPEEGRRRC